MATKEMQVDCWARQLDYYLQLGLTLIQASTLASLDAKP